MMALGAQGGAGRDIFAPSVAVAGLPSGEATLDQLLAEPIVKQLMRRDGTDEGAIRHLMRKMAARG